MATSVHLLKLFVGLSALVELAAWPKKKPETVKVESKPRELVHARRCDPTELFPVLSQIRAHLVHRSSALTNSGFLNACPFVQGCPMRVSSRQHRWHIAPQRTA